MTDLLERANELSAEFIAYRRDFHQHPELGFEEVRTAKIDFSYFAEKVPSCFFSLGAMNRDKQCDYPGHHPKFNFDEDAIPVG
ncbi:MAG: hypothetical protein Q8S19_02415, partial [Bacillota bacterium]|nr:hypothetical protein [Bacillota bacterium]